MASDLLTIYGHMVSPPTRTVIAFVNLNQIPFTFQKVDFIKGQHRSKEFRAINPVGQVPVITHGEFKLAESAAIIFYLGEIYHINNQYFPADPHERAKINSYFHWHHTNTRKHASLLAYTQCIGPEFFAKLPATEEQLAPLRASLGELLTTLEGILSTGQYIARTANLTVADIHCYSELAQLELIGYDFGTFPALMRWQAEVGAIPAVFEAHQTLRKVVENFVSQTAASPIQ